jgi:hypothetical protein
MLARSIVVPGLVLATAVVAVLSFAKIPVSQTGLAAPKTLTCAGDEGSGVAGSVPKVYGARAMLQILPAQPYGEVYLEAVRERMGLPRKSAAPITPLETLDFTKNLRYATIDRDGRFVCRPLEPGRYIAVETMAAAGRALIVDVAAFDLGSARGTTSLAQSQFRPLQEVR